MKVEWQSIYKSIYSMNVCHDIAKIGERDCEIFANVNLRKQIPAKIVSFLCASLSIYNLYK